MFLSDVVEPSPPRQQLRTIEGQIKLSIQYKQEMLNVMVMHVKDLVSSSKLKVLFVHVYNLFYG